MEALVVSAAEHGIWTIQTSVFPRTLRAWRSTNVSVSAPSVAESESPSLATAGTPFCSS